MAQLGEKSKQNKEIPSVEWNTEPDAVWQFGLLAAPNLGEYGGGDGLKLSCPSLVMKLPSSRIPQKFFNNILPNHINKCIIENMKINPQQRVARLPEKAIKPDSLKDFTQTCHFEIQSHVPLSKSNRYNIMYQGFLFKEIPNDPQRLGCSLFPLIGIYDSFGCDEFEKGKNNIDHLEDDIHFAGFDALQWADQHCHLDFGEWHFGSDMSKIIVNKTNDLIKFWSVCVDLDNSKLDVSLIYIVNDCNLSEIEKMARQMNPQKSMEKCIQFYQMFVAMFNEEFTQIPNAKYDLSMLLFGYDINAETINNESNDMIEEKKEQNALESDANAANIKESDANAPNNNGSKDANAPNAYDDDGGGGSEDYVIVEEQALLDETKMDIDDCEQTTETSSNSILQIFQFQIECICVYPIKSCAPIIMNSANDMWPYTANGFVYDREWMIINELTKQKITQREYGKLCLIQPSLSEKSKYLKLSIRDYGDMQIDVSDKKAGDCGDDIAAFLSGFVGVKCRLIRNEMGNPSHDSHPFFVVFKESISELNNEIIERNKENKEIIKTEMFYDFLRFRPNVLLSGMKENVKESVLKVLSFEKNEFNCEVNVWSDRCLDVTNIDYSDNANIDCRNEPKQTIQICRKSMFGVALNAVSPNDTGFITVGNVAMTTVFL